MRDDKQFLLDIVEAAETISEQVAGLTIEAFLENKMLQQSVLFSFTIIGEASRKLSDEAREAHPEIAWSSMIGFCNIIVHSYFSLNLNTVWLAATNRVLPLAEQVRSIIKLDFDDTKGGESS